MLHLATKPTSRESDDVTGGSKSDKSNAWGSESEEEPRSGGGGGGTRGRFRPLHSRRKKRQHGWPRPAVSIPLFDYLGSKFKDLTTLKRFAHGALLPEAEPLVNGPLIPSPKLFYFCLTRQLIRRQMQMLKGGQRK